jgi:hypothetical protein
MLALGGDRHGERRMHQHAAARGSIETLHAFSCLPAVPGVARFLHLPLCCIFLFAFGRRLFAIQRVAAAGGITVALNYYRIYYHIPRTTSRCTLRWALRAAAAQLRHVQRRVCARLRAPARIREHSPDVLVGRCVRDWRRTGK